MSMQGPRSLDLAIPISNGILHSTLTIPPNAAGPIGLVIFAHGTGSSRHSERNQRVALHLQEQGLATLLFDLLTTDETTVDEARALQPIDIDVLADRLVAVTDWIADQAEIRGLPIGYFGSSTGAAVAMEAATRRAALVRAIVSRGGRTDLPDDVLKAVRAPTLLIVGGADHEIRKTNEAAAHSLKHHHLAVITDASHLFEEPGALAEVSRLAGEWLIGHLSGTKPVERRTSATPHFADRRSAGRALAVALKPRVGPGAIILGLPRGGVPVADEVARALGAALDIWVVRKIGAPLQPEFGVGAIAEGPSFFLDEQAADQLEISREDLEAVVLNEAEELRRRVACFRGGPPPLVRGRTVVVIDDGVATGGTVRAVLRAVHAAGAVRVILAVPVASAQTLAILRREADEVVCLSAPRDLISVGRWYDTFPQVADEEVLAILSTRERRRPQATASH
jgi:putative phosphoribosyl transferase